MVKGVKVNGGDVLLVQVSLRSTYSLSRFASQYHALAEKKLVLSLDWYANAEELGGSLKPDNLLFCAAWIDDLCCWTGKVLLVLVVSLVTNTVLDSWGRRLLADFLATFH